MVNADETKIGPEDNFVNYIKPYKSAEVRHITSVLSNIDILKLRDTIDYYPIRFLADGVAAFRYGFSEAAIFHAGASVEMGLLGLLRDKVNQVTQVTTHPKISFFWLIKNADKYLNKNERKTCHDIRRMRNCYVHYENVFAHLAFQQEVRLPKILEKIKLEFGEDINLTKLIEEMNTTFEEEHKYKGMLGIRIRHLETPEMISFIDGRHKAYIEWLLRKEKPTKKELEVIYTLEAFDALDCLTWAFEINKKLGFIKT